MGNKLFYNGFEIPTYENDDTEQMSYNYDDDCRELYGYEVRELADAII